MVTVIIEDPHHLYTVNNNNILMLSAVGVDLNGVGGVQRKSKNAKKVVAAHLTWVTGNHSNCQPGLVTS